jgi:hypothetical protein
MSRKNLLLASSLFLAMMLFTPFFITSSIAADHPLKGQKIDMAILGIGGWLPSRLGVDMSPLFAEYAKKEFRL